MTSRCAIMSSFRLIWHVIMFVLSWKLRTMFSIGPAFKLLKTTTDNRFWPFLPSAPNRTQIIAQRNNCGKYSTNGWFEFFFYWICDFFCFCSWTLWFVQTIWWEIWKECTGLVANVIAQVKISDHFRICSAILSKSAKLIWYQAKIKTPSLNLNISTTKNSNLLDELQVFKDQTFVPLLSLI